MGHISGSSGEKISQYKRSAVLVSALILLSSLPGAVAQSMTFPGSSDFGIYEDIRELMAEIHEKRNSTDLYWETEAVMEVMREVPFKRLYLVDKRSDVVKTSFTPPPDNEMVDSVLSTPIADYDSIVDFLLGNPLSYMVYFKYRDQPHHWIRGSAINLYIFNPTNADWTYIDVDDDRATGDPDGNDVRVRFKVEPRQVMIYPNGTLFNVDFNGGLAFQIENLNPNSNETSHLGDRVPLDIGVAKSVSFDGKNYIIMLKFRFEEQIPMHHSLSIIMNVYFTDIAWNLVLDLLQLSWDQIAQDISDAIEGPYVIEWGPMTTYAGFVYSRLPIPLQNVIRLILEAMGIGAPQGGRYDPERLPSVDIMAGIGNVTRTPDGYGWKEISWINAKIKPVENDADRYLPGLGNLTLDTRSDDTAFDSITWRYPEDYRNPIHGYPSDVRAIYCDARDNESFFADIRIDDMPYFLRLELKNNSNDEVMSRLALSSSTRVGRLNYTEYLYRLDPGPYPQLPVKPRNPYRIMHIDLWDLPTHIVLSGTFDSGAPSEPDLGTGNLITQFFNAVIGYFYKGFWGVGNTLRSISERIFNMPSGGGWFKIRMFGHTLGGIEFWYTSNRYVMLDGNGMNGKDRDFIAFYNDRNPWVEIPISGRVRDVGDLYAYFGNTTEVDLKLKGERSFYLTYIDEEARWDGKMGYYQENATLYIESIPPIVNISVTDDTFSIHSVGGSVGNASFVAVINGTYMWVQLTSLPNGMDLYHEDSDIQLNFSSPLETMQFIITDDSCYRMEEPHLLLRRTLGSTMISGRLDGLKTVRYETGNATRFSYSLSRSYPFYIMVNDTLLKTRARVAVMPLPPQLDLTLSAKIGGENIEIPSIGDISTFFDLSNVLVSVASIGASVTEVLSNVTQDSVDLLKHLGSNDRFFYETSHPLNLVAEIEMGDISTLGPVEWTHGISMKRQIVNDEIAMYARIFLNGLPRSFKLISHTDADLLDISLNMFQYSSEYDWILMDIQGLMDRDIFIYLSGLREGMNVKIDLNFSADMTPGVGYMTGRVNWSLSKPLAQIYLRTISQDLPRTIVTVYMSDPPVWGNLTYNVTHDTHVSMKAERWTKRLLYEMAKYIDEDWRRFTVLARDVPDEFSIDIEANPEYDIDDPSPVQGFPSIRIRTSQEGTSLTVHQDGRAMGQRGDLDLYVVKLPILLSAREIGGEIILDGPVEYIMLRYSGLPLRKDYEIRSMEICAKDLRKLTVSIRMTFGNLPIIRLDARNSGDIRLIIDHVIDLYGRRDAKVVFLDIALRDGIPDAGSLGMNEITLKGGEEHTVMPELISTFVLTLLG